jgi:hypothetical protein
VPQLRGDLRLQLIERPGGVLTQLKTGAGVEEMPPRQRVPRWAITLTVSGIDGPSHGPSNVVT